jgi:hypothetical protein
MNTLVYPSPVSYNETQFPEQCYPRNSEYLNRDFLRLHRPFRNENGTSDVQVLYQSKNPTDKQTDT